MRAFAAACLGVLLLPQSGSQAPGPVSIEMRNVILHAAPDAVCRGELAERAAAQLVWPHPRV